ncbi:MAG: hypothetical protein FJ303_17635 [Planctomycetes bacterium]|nr:hypothetical protein [Planctomycetota bacterium]
MRLSLALLFCLVPFTDGRAGQEKTVELAMLKDGDGATFGEWTVWRYDEHGKALLLIHAKSGLTIYLPWLSNGWINYRQKTGDWHIQYSKGDPKTQKREALKIEPFLSKKSASSLEPGKYRFDAWTVTVTKDAIDFRCSTADDRLTVRRTSGEAVHTGRVVGGKK